MNNQGLTLTMIANMTANYGEGMGNITTVQKVFRGGKTYAIRSRESLKNALMVQSGMYDDLVVSVTGVTKTSDVLQEQSKKAHGVTQKVADETRNAANCRALEGGYMNTSGDTVIRNSSFYLTDAVACEPFVIETRFHNNLYMAQTYAKQEGMNLQASAGKCGLMPYQYEYDKSMKQYSLTIDLDRVGLDDNFQQEAPADEKAARVIAILDAVESLQLVVKGNLDNAEPLFVVGGIGPRKTHYFENVVNAHQGKLALSEELQARAEKTGYQAALLTGGKLANEQEIIDKLHPVSISRFFDDLRGRVREYYGV